MPTTKGNLKPSHQSLQSRGLPYHQQQGCPRTAVSYFSSDSETDKRIDSMTKGLDKCSSLLNVLLKQSDSIETKESKKEKKKKIQKVKIVSPKKINKVQKGDKIKNPPFNKRLPSSTPVSKSPRKMKDLSTDSGVLHKEDMLSINTVDELIEQREHLKDYLKQVTEQKAQIEAEYHEIVSSQKSPLKDDNNQKDDFSIDKARESKQTDPMEPEKPYEVAPVNGALEILMKSISDKLSLTGDSIMRSKLKESTSCCISPKTDSHNSSNFISSKVALSNGQPTTDMNTNKSTNLSFSKHEHSDENISHERLTNISMQNFEKSRSQSPTSSPTNSKQKSILKNKSLNITPRKEQTTKVSNETTQVSNVNSTTVYGGRRETIPQSNGQIVTLKYLMKDLHKMLNDRRDLELDRLLEEINHVIGILPFMMSNITFENSGEEIEVLKIENMDLQRKLQMEKQNVSNVKKNHQSQMDRLAADLKKELDEKDYALQDAITRRSQLSKQIEEVRKATDELKFENQRILEKMSEQDMKYLNYKQQWLKEKSTLSKEITSVKDELAEARMMLQVLEKEKNILEISSQQQNSEIQRLTSLNKDLQNSISTLLADIESQRTKPHTRLQYKLPTKTKKLNGHITANKSSANTRHYFEQCMNKDLVSTITEEGEHLEDIKTLTPVSSSLSTLSHLSSNVTDSSVSTLKTFDNIDFQNDMIHLDAKIDVVRDTLEKQRTARR